MDFLPDHSWASRLLFVPLYHSASTEAERNSIPFGYLAFAHDLIAEMRPKVIVQLGAHPDELYFACCQSVAQNGLDSLCYGLYSGPDDAATRAYNDSQYSAFSHLLSVDEHTGVSQFADGSIDWLHIHAGQSYESARDTFRNWMPKLRSGAVVLIANIHQREAGSGVWQLWDEITAEFQHTFAFAEGGGLGVVQMGEDHRESSPALLRSLFAGSETESEFLRRYYTFYTAYLRSRLQPQAEMVPSHAYRTLLLELQTAQAERMLAVAELKEVVEQRNAARRELYQIEHDLQAQKAHSAQLDIDVANWKHMVDYERNIREQILASLSWKLTTPLRMGIAWLRKLRG